MPSAIRKDQDLADDGLVSILVESQGADERTLQSFLWQRFPENGCFSSVGVFVPIPESRGIPHAAVIGVDGRLLWAGNPLRDSQRVDELIEEQLRLVAKGWGDSSDARKVRAKLYGKGDLAGAAGLVEKMDDGEEKQTLQKEVETRYAVRKNAVEALRQQGRWRDALEAAEELAKSVGRHPAWSAEVEGLVAGFETDAAKAELDADKDLEKILRVMRKGKLDRAPRDLEKLVEKHGQTRVAARAARVLAALRS